MNEKSPVLSGDEHNERLEANVHPHQWINPKPAPRYNLVVIGAGTAGLVSAAIAANLGARVALVEKRYMGGDCLNFGCVPSKTLIRSARASHHASVSSRFGIECCEPVAVNFSLVMDRVRGIRSKISAHDSVQRFTKMGVDVFLGEAVFASNNRIEVAGSSLFFKKSIIATGTRPFIPNIPGLSESGFLTNETVFELKVLPKRLAIIGAGPIGCELAQAFQRLGSQVILIHKNEHILDREDAQAAAIVQDQFIREGIDLRLQSQVSHVMRSNEFRKINLIQSDREECVEVDAILVASGRVPNVTGLGLDLAGVIYDEIHGIKVNDYLQTSNPSIFSAGDVCMKQRFTHVADATARIAIENALFRKSKKTSDLIIPWCTYTDPEIAHVGIYENEAAGMGAQTRSISIDISEVDRSITDGCDTGFCKVLIDVKNGRILGATIVGPVAGEMVSEITLAMKANIRLADISSTIYPYPTQSMILKKIADTFMGSRLTPKLKWLSKTWFSMRRLI